MTSPDQVRPDLVRAWNDITDTTSLKHERAHLPDRLGEGETVTSLTPASYQHKSGLLVLTGRRVFFFAHRKRRKNFIEIPWEPGCPVSWSKSWLQGKLSLTVGGSTFNFDIFNKKDGDQFVEALRSHTFSEPAAAPPQWYAGPTASAAAPEPQEGEDRDHEPTPSPTEIVSAIARLAELHEQGALTKEEFAAAKAGLLAQLSAGPLAE